MQKLLTLNVLFIILLSTAAYGEPLTIEIRTHKEPQELSDLDIQSFDLSIEGLWTNNEFESEMIERSKAFFESTGLSFRDDVKTGYLIGILFNGFTSYGNDLPGLNEWPNQTSGKGSKDSGEKGVVRTITVHVLAPPLKNVPVQIWTGFVSCQSLESDTQGLARIMLDEILSEYPNGSGKPNVREVKM